MAQTSSFLIERLAIRQEAEGTGTDLAAGGAFHGAPIVSGGFPKVISQTQWGGFVISWGWARELEIDSFSSLTFDFCSTPSFSATPSHIHTDRTLAFGPPRDLPLAFSGDFWPMSPGTAQAGSAQPSGLGPQFFYL